MGGRCRDRFTAAREPQRVPAGVILDATNDRAGTYGDVRVRLRLIITVSLIVGTFLGILAWRSVNGDLPWSTRVVEGSPAMPVAQGEPSADPAELTATTASTSREERPAYVVTRDGTLVRSADGTSSVEAAGGVLLPILGELDGGYLVFDTCNNEAMVSADEVELGTVPVVRNEARFDHAVFVIDPGHGVPDYGAVGPAGLSETEVNLDVSARLVELLRSPHDIDWATGEVLPGDSVPAAAEAVLTRSPDGPNGGQFQLGLTYRATVANALDATALVSIHHNTMPEAPLDHPGSEAYVSLANEESPRLGALIVDELRTSLSRFEADWMGTPGSGLTSRVNGDGEDYYTLLAESQVPAVITEGLYISNPTEEALAMRDDVRQTYAEAVYRALVRFVTTDDAPLPPPEPDLWEVDRPGPSLDSCTVPPLGG